MKIDACWHPEEKQYSVCSRCGQVTTTFDVLTDQLHDAREETKGVKALWATEMEVARAAERERDAAEAQRDVLRGVLMRLASASKPVADRLYDDGTVPPPEVIRLGETTQFALAVLEEGRSNE